MATMVVDGDLYALSKSVQLLGRSVGGAGKSGNKPAINIEVNMLIVQL